MKVKDHGWWGGGGREEAKVNEEYKTSVHWYTKYFFCFLHLDHILNIVDCTSPRHVLWGCVLSFKMQSHLSSATWITHHCALHAMTDLISAAQPLHMPQTSVARFPGSAPGKRFTQSYRILYKLHWGTDIIANSLQHLDPFRRICSVASNHGQGQSVQ